MTIKYILESWNPKSKKYQKLNEWDNIEMAEKMFNKPYNRIHTRRLIKIHSEILYAEKGVK